MNGLDELQVTIVGLGLMGGSLAGALRGQCRVVVGVARQRETAEQAVSRGLVDRGTIHLVQGLAQADIAVLATPVRTTLRLLDEIGPLLPDGTLLLDLGSTKAQVVHRMESLPRHVQPLGGHPMCGREVSGLAAADPSLYHNRLFVLTPLARTSPEALELGRTIATAVGARPLLLEAQEHDRLVATISHLPYLLASALVATAEVEAAEEPRLWQVAASGFRDTSRLAASDVTMMLDILLTNREAVLAALQDYAGQLGHLAGLLAGDDEEKLRSALQAIAARRKGWAV
jgi:prephenate dehydrogenase